MRRRQVSLGRVFRKSPDNGVRLPWRRLHPGPLHGLRQDLAGPGAAAHGANEPPHGDQAGARVLPAVDRAQLGRRDTQVAGAGH